MIEKSKEALEISQGLLTSKELEQLIKLAMNFPDHAQFINMVIESLKKGNYFETFKSIYEYEDITVRNAIITLLNLK